jgi:aryl-alcohol dehydrogenase-like predicted oxidoreductase
MQYRRFGRTGWNVSEIGYGMWGMAGWTGSEDAESLASLQRAVDLGCNFFDTAWTIVIRRNISRSTSTRV